MFRGAIICLGEQGTSSRVEHRFLYAFEASVTDRQLARFSRVKKRFVSFESAAARILKATGSHPTG